MKKPNQIIINGICEDCSEEARIYKQKEYNNSITQLDTSDNQIIDSKEAIWRNEMFSTNRIQMDDTEQVQSGIDIEKIVDKMIEDQRQFQKTFKPGYALKSFGISESTRQDILIHRDELQQFLEKHSKKLLDTNNKKYTLVFLDACIDNLTDKQRIGLEGSETHFFLLDITNCDIEIAYSNVKDIQKETNEYILNFNTKNS